MTTYFYNRRDMYTLMQVLDRNNIKYNFEDIKIWLSMITPKYNVWNVIDDIIKEEKKSIIEKDLKEQSSYHVGSE